MDRPIPESTPAHVVPGDSLAGMRFHRTREAAAFLTKQYGLPIATATLDTMVSRGGGPPFRKWGRFRVYEEADLVAWAAKRCGAPRDSSSNAA